MQNDLHYAVCIIIIFILAYNYSEGSIILYSTRDYHSKYVPILSCVCDDVFLVVCSYIVCTFLDNYMCTDVFTTGVLGLGCVNLQTSLDL